MQTEQQTKKIPIRICNQGEVIIQAGTPATDFFIILNGSIEVYRGSRLLRVLGAGDVMGFEYLYLNMTSTITAIAREESRIAVYHSGIVHELIDDPKLLLRVLKSLGKQLEETGASVNEIEMQKNEPIPQEMQQQNQSAPFLSDAAEDDLDYIVIRSDESTLFGDILGEFLEEAQGLLLELRGLGEKLKNVGVPDAVESAILDEFAQKLNRLIGGTAAMGFEKFAMLSRKTSLLALRCSQIKDMPIRLLISNLNLTVSVLARCFNSVESIKKAEEQIPLLEKRIDICMASVGISNPKIKSQDEINDILEAFKKTT